MSDDLTLEIGGRAITGWSAVRVTRGIERCPSDFELSLTSDSAVYLDAALIREGDPCVVKLGSDVALTGFVDAITASYDSQQHRVGVIGRGRCADLVDCAAEWPNGQFGNADLLTLANGLGKVYEPPITASATAPTGEPIPKFVIGIGESGWGLLERLARVNGLLIYEGPDGNIIFAQAGAESAASGFAEGENVLAATYSRNVAERFSYYACYYAGIDLYPDQSRDKPYFGKALDPNIRRNRKSMVVAEAGTPAQELCERRTLWEAARRMGRGTQVRLTCDSWRDAAGKLWTPNTLVSVSLPHLGLPPTILCIGEVTYSRDEGGTAAEVTLMPREAFLPEPQLLFPPLQLPSSQAG